METPQEDKQSVARKKLADLFASLNKSRLANIDDGICYNANCSVAKNYAYAIYFCGIYE